MSKTSVFGIAKTQGMAEQIVEKLQTSGFAASEISILLPDTAGQHDIGHVKATKAPEGASTGAAAGGVTGGVLGLLAGIGALAIPGVGPFIAAGPIMAALAGGKFGAPSDAQQRIFEKHLAPWLGRFFDDLSKASGAEFYRAVGALGRVFIDIETEAFALPA